MLQARIALVGAVLVVLSACRIQITAPEHGSVVTESGSLDCGPSDTCNVEVVDIFFNETFIAQPEAGYEFDQWRRDPLHFCGGSNAPCNLYTSFYEGNDLLMALLESDDIWYLEPVFKQPDTWTRKADLPIASPAVSTCVVDRKLYAFGLGHGHAPNDRSNRVEMYDPPTDTWTRKADMPTARVWSTAGAINGKCYVVGGGGGSADPGSATAVEEYDPQTDSWRARSPLPQSRSTSASAVVEGKLHVFGGVSIPKWLSPGTSDSFVYDPATDQWSTVADMPTALQAMAAGEIDGYIYLVGGAESGLSLTDHLQRYDPARDRWTTGAKVPIQLSHATASVYDGSLYVFGGLDAEDTDAAIASVYRYDPGVDEWTELTRMAKMRQSFASETIDGRIYVVGGRAARTTQDSQDLVDVDEYTP